MGGLGFGEEALGDLAFFGGGVGGGGGLVALEGGDGFVVAAEAVQRAADVDLQTRVGDAGEGLLEGDQGGGVVGGLGELAAAAELTPALAVGLARGRTLRMGMACDEGEQQREEAEEEAPTPPAGLPT